MAAMIAVIAGCGTNQTILPEGEREMIDIYREALSQVDAGDNGLVDPQVVCASLKLKKNTKLEDCVAVLNEAAADALSDLDGPIPPQPLDYVPYTRQVESELENLFPRLPNPDIVIYVYPHLATRSRAPIPGYSSVISLYERVEYQLPGETPLPTPRPAAAVAAHQPGETQ